MGGQVYRPIGMEWAEKGFWKVYDHPATQLQFLTLDQGYLPVDGTPPLNTFYGEPPANLQDGVYYCADPENETFNKAITFEKFLEMDIDIIIASMPEHIQPFQKLIREYKPNAKLIFQVGNNWNVPAGIEVRNVLASAKIPAPEGVNFVSYHQEFSQEIFRPDFSYPEPNIYSFVNLFHETSDWPTFEHFRALMALRGYSCKAFGGQCPDGVIGGVHALADKMREARFVWHTKPGGDGFGHVIHNAFSVGRPVIVRKSHYAGQLAEALLTDQETCIDLDAHSIGEAYTLIEYWARPGNWERMARAARQRFEEIVDYDAEAKQISQFVNELR